MGGRVSTLAVGIAPDGGGCGLGVTFILLAGLGAAFLVGMNDCRSVDVATLDPVDFFLPVIRGSPRTPRAFRVFPFPLTSAKDDGANSLLPARSTFSGKSNVKGVRIEIAVAFLLASHELTVESNHGRNKMHRHLPESWWTCYLERGGLGDVLFVHEAPAGSVGIRDQCIGHLWGIC